jgi:hypothetical protein
VSITTTDEPPRAHPAVETAFLAPEAVLWDGRHHQVHHLNPSASAVWLCIDGELTADQIAAELSEIFETPLEVIRPDVDSALAEFLRLGLLDGREKSDAAASPTVADGHDEHGHHHDDPVEEAPDGEGVVVLARPPDP